MSAIKLNVEGLNVRFVSGQKETHAVRDATDCAARAG